MVATRAAVDRCGPGHVLSPLSPTVTEDGRAGEEDNEMHFTATFWANPPPQAVGTEYFSLEVEDVPAASSRPDRLFAVSGPQERVLRHTVEQMGDCVPVVPSLDVPVPQMVDEPVVVLRGLDTSMPVEQGIEVPKITLEGQDPAASRASRAAAGGTVGGSADSARVRTCGGCSANLGMDGSSSSV